MYREFLKHYNQDSESGGNMPALKVVMFLGSVREGRFADRVGKFMRNYLEKTGHSVDVLDPKELRFPLMEKALHHYKDQSQAPELLRTCGEKIKNADAFVIVTCEYNHAIPPALVNLLDYFELSLYSYKPSGIVCYSAGQYGGMRAAMPLRAMLGELGCISVSNIFGIPVVYEALNEDGEPLNEHMEKGAKMMITQLDWMAHAMKNHRVAHGVPQ